MGTGCHEFYFPIWLGFLSSSQLTKSYSSEGWPNHQPVIVHGTWKTWKPVEDILADSKAKNLARTDMEVYQNRGTPKSSILVGFSLINQQFWGSPISGTPIWLKRNFCLWLLQKRGRTPLLIDLNFSDKRTEMAFWRRMAGTNWSWWWEVF